MVFQIKKNYIKIILEKKNEIKNTNSIVFSLDLSREQTTKANRKKSLKKRSSVESS